jgi:hypothetical protein
LAKNHSSSLGINFDFESGDLFGPIGSEKIDNIDESEIKYLINKFRLESEFRWNVLKKFDQLSKTTKLYQSVSFINFLRKISKSENRNELLAFLYILHNLILMSKKYDHQIYSEIVANYSSLLAHVFITFKGKYSYSQAKNMMHSLDLSNEEWCKLHGERIKNAIANDIAEEEIEKIYDDITYLRNNNYESLSRYRKYLGKKDKHIEIKKRIEALLISD